MVKKKIPLHLLQAGGVVPINSPQLNLGETAPMIFQAASQPIDSGVGAIVNFSQLAQRRKEQSFREYAFEVQRDFSEREMDLAERRFSWQKKIWDLEWDNSLQEQYRANLLAAYQLANGLSVSNPKTAAGRTNAGGGHPQNFHNPGQVAAAEEAERVAAPYLAGLNEWMVGDPRENPSGLNDAMLGIKRAYTSDNYIAAENQRYQYESQMKVLSEDEEGLYDPEVALWKQQQYYQSTDPKDDVKLTYRSSKSIIDEMAEQYTTDQGVPVGIILTGPDGSPLPANAQFMQAIQVSPAMGEEVVEVLKSDPYGTYRQRFLMEQEMRAKNKEEPLTEEDYDAWLDAKARNDLRMYGKAQEVKTIGTPQGLEAAAVTGPAGSDNRRSVTMPQVQTNPLVVQRGDKSRREAENVTSGDAYMGIDFIDDTGTNAQREYYTPGQGLGTPVAGAKRPASERTGLRISPDKPETGENWVKWMVQKHTGTPMDQVDIDQYVDEEGFFTPEMVDIYKNVRKSGGKVQYTPVVHQFDNIQKIKEQGNKTEREVIEETYDPINGSTGGEMYMDAVTGEMLSQEQMVQLLKSDAEQGGLDDVEYTYLGYADSRNTYAMLAAQNNTGVADPSAYGVEPLVFQVTGTDERGVAVQRQFILPQDLESRQNNPYYQSQLAQNKAFNQAALGDGDMIPLSFDTEEQRNLVYGLLWTQRYSGMTNEEFVNQVEEINSALVAVQAETNENGEFVGVAYHLDSDGGRADGKLVVTTDHETGFALSVANDLRKMLQPGDEFEIVEFYDDRVGASGFQITINGEEPHIVIPEMNRDGSLDYEGFTEDLIHVSEFGGKPYTELRVEENGTIDGFRAMNPLPQDSTLVPKFHKSFVKAFSELDAALYEQGYNYDFTSMWRADQTSDHGRGRAADLRYRPETSLDEFFRSYNPEFKVSPPGKVVPYKIVINGEEMWVARHDNRGSVGTHYHVAKKQNPWELSDQPLTDE